jgi:hypothetical protein
MITHTKPTKSLATHAACISAGMRDGLRAAQYYARDLSGVDGGKAPRHITFLSRAVARAARGFDRSMSKAADVSVSIVKPSWRNLPSPFEPAVRSEVIEAINQNQFAYTSQFTAYFFRAARHILERGANAPNLILEHRIEAARRDLEVSASATGAPTSVFTMAQVLMKLVLAAPIARCGTPKPGYDFLKMADPNIAVLATACLALLLAQEGKPLAETNEDEFFEISGALLAPYLDELSHAIAAQDVAAVARVLDSVKNLY